eukprot:10012732-Lingulodinium_polyedra.AAC.1
MLIGRTVCTFYFPTHRPVLPPFLVDWHVLHTSGCRTTGSAVPDTSRGRTVGSTNRVASGSPVVRCSRIGHVTTPCQ